MWSRSLISRNVALAPVGSSRTHWAGAHVLGRQAMQPSGVDEYRLTSKIRSPERPCASALLRHRTRCSAPPDRELW
jgi:hypothetical protein